MGYWVREAEIAGSLRESQRLVVFPIWKENLLRMFSPSILAVESWWKPIVGEDSELPREESSQVIWGPNVLLITYLSVIGYFA